MKPLPRTLCKRKTAGPARFPPRPRTTPRLRVQNRAGSATIAGKLGASTEAVMPVFGAHLSVAGGLYRAAEAAAALGCATVQIFTKNASQWAGKPLADEDVRAFKR